MSPRTAPPKKSTKQTRHTTPTLPPIFNDPVSTPDPTKYKVPHASDTQAYNEMEALIKASKFLPLPFPVNKVTEPVLTLATALGPSGKATVATIQSAGSIVFQCAGDTGAAYGPQSENTTVDKMLTDFANEPAAALPQFFYHLGDIVYSFGEHKYYYDQFYAAFRNYPRPIVAIPGNHDGIVLPPPAGSGIDADSLSAFLANFCTPTPTHSADAVGISRTSMIQPGVYYTFDSPFVRILGLYSNQLENPGVISSTKDPTTGKPQFPNLSDAQLTYLTAALTRIKKQKYAGAVIIAVHHPPYSFGIHTGSMVMLKEIDAICQKIGVWPHAILSGHAHSYQRFTRTLGTRQIPFIVCGNGGHGLSPITTGPPLRTPQSMPIFAQPAMHDAVTFESYDDQNFGYLRIIADPLQLRIEYHSATAGSTTKTPNDAVTVELTTTALIHYIPAAEQKLKPFSNIRKAMKR